MATLGVIPNTGIPNSFDSVINGGLLLNKEMLDSLARANHTTVMLYSAIITYAIELNFSHVSDETVRGAGKTFILNPLGYRKNIA